MTKERPVTQQPEGGEPSGEQDAANEQEIVEATEEVSGLGSRVSDIESERDKYLELAQRTQADFENYRKRAAKEAAAAGGRAKAGLVRELLPVLDNLERALQLAGNGGTDGDAFVEGVRLVHADLVGVLQRSGVESFDPSGEPFDPTLHEALSTRPQDGAHPGTVVEVVEKGYRLNETILRPARVVVSQ
ncbi:MAG TPA: nucleotide exchange factor GrpE [Thermoleophilaceae bacterium]|nr:nucleotide exchange factor GrpE [Thermoleophilaceae bacterium]